MPLDNGVRLLFGLLAPHHDGLMLYATSVIGNDGDHVFMGASETAVLTRFDGARAVLTDGLVMVRRERACWPPRLPSGLRTRSPRRHPRTSSAGSARWKKRPSARRWMPMTPGRLIGEHTFHSTTDLDWRRKALGVARPSPQRSRCRFLRFDPPPARWADLEAAPHTPVH